MEPLGQVSSSLTSLMKEFRTITNNIANSSTTGFKRTINSFSKELSEQQKLAGGVGQTDMLKGNVKTNTMYDLNQGILVKTDRTLDLGIAGKGWFVLETENGPLYTRNGVFFTNENSQIVDGEGNLVGGTEGAIIIPPDTPLNDIYISSDGSVGYKDMIFGKLRIVDFGPDRDRLSPAGACRYRAPVDLKPKPAEEATVQQGYQESSNVNITEELVDLMRVMRTYETNMKLLNKKSENNKAILQVAAG